MLNRALDRIKRGTATHLCATPQIRPYARASILPEKRSLTSACVGPSEIQAGAGEGMPVSCASRDRLIGACAHFPVRQRDLGGKDVWTAGARPLHDLHEFLRLSKLLQQPIDVLDVSSGAGSDSAAAGRVQDIRIAPLGPCH